MNNKSRKIIFRVDGGRVYSVSLGHVFRCMALAEELMLFSEFEVSFMMKDYEDGVKVVKDKGYNIQVIDKDMGIDDQIKIIEAQCPGLVVFDLFEMEFVDLSILHDKGIKTVIIDDLGNKMINSNVLINGSIAEEMHQYFEKSDQTIYYIGPEYTILGSDFEKLPKRKIKKEVKQIMISMGGSDPTNLTVDIVNSLRNLNLSVKILIILGPASQKEFEVTATAEKGNCKFEVLRYVPNIAQVMAESDIAITAGGRMALELAATGTPGIIIPSIEHEDIVSSKLEEVNAVIKIDNFSCAKESELHDSIYKLVNEHELRVTMSRNCQNLIDGNGKSRVLKIIEDILYS
ncbi:MAG: glycosyltransferase [Pseudomonadota bacterium]